MIDANGPVFFLRALNDTPSTEVFDCSSVAEAWLNYSREGVGMFWWGGYGVSTEHTAYLNLKAGIPAPKSGSIEINGKTLAEQIGGQIFIDTWGFLFPEDCRNEPAITHSCFGFPMTGWLGGCCLHRRSHSQGVRD